MSRRVFVGICSVAFGIVISTSGATLTKIDDAALAPLRNERQKHIRLERLPLYGSRTTPIDLEEFQVWAPDGKIFAHDAQGNVTKLPPPNMRFYRGQVNGDPESFAYFSVEVSTGKISGLVATKDDNFAVDGVRRQLDVKLRNRTLDTGDATSGYDYYLTSTNANDMNMPIGTPWQCDVEQSHMAPNGLRRTQTDAKGMPIQSQALTGTQHYAIRLEIETDDELYANAGCTTPNPCAAETTYITNLTGAVSTIYNRDLKTDVVLTGIHTHTGGPGTDVWLQGAGTEAALYEFGTYYHNNPGYQIGPHSAAVFLSGKNLSGGIAWEGIICGGDVFCGVDGRDCNDGVHPYAPAANKYAGAYAWCGLIGNGGFGSVPNPDATTNGALYGLPTGQQNYWPLSEYAHELGHNLAGHHTHCVAITDAERITSGFTDGSAAAASSNFVDHCFATEVGCFSGVNYQPGSQTVFRGTIMSYCHNVFSGAVPQSRYTFGLAAEPSHHELDDYMFTAAPVNGATNIVTATSATMNSFTAPASVAPNSSGNTASIATMNAATFNWTITGGTITSATNTSSITFTAAASGNVVLKATAYGANSCGVTDTRTVTITGVTLNPPTGVEAHAISMTQALISWTAPAAGTVPAHYNVYRSADGMAYTKVGNPSGTNFTDTVSTNKAYLYKVKSADLTDATESADSNIDLATIVIYTNSISIGGMIQTADLNELRVAVDAVRAMKMLAAGAYTYGTGSPSRITAGTVIHAADINELRTNLNAGFAALGFASPSYTYSITAGTSIVHATDFTELRNFMQ